MTATPSERSANNHRRFVRAGSQSDLVFDGYAQDEWVRVQAHDAAPLHLKHHLSQVHDRVREAGATSGSGIR